NAEQIAQRVLVLQTVQASEHDAPLPGSRVSFRRSDSGRKPGQQTLLLVVRRARLPRGGHFARFHTLGDRRPVRPRGGIGQIQLQSIEWQVPLWLIAAVAAAAVLLQQRSELLVERTAIV